MPQHRPPSLARPNLLERAIERVAPQWALRRHRARATMALTGGYVGAGYSERFAAWSPGHQDPDADVVLQLDELRGRSRDLARNAPIAAGAIETDVTHVIGCGLTLQSRIDREVLGLSEAQAAAWQRRAERRWRLFAQSTFCDATGEHTFAELEELGYRTARESGDGFVVLTEKRRAGWPFKLALQLIEADRVCNPDFRPDTDRLVAGIERDAIGAKLAVHIASHHPGGSHVPRGRITWTRVPIHGGSGRRNVLHIKRSLRPGQTRGIPALATIIATLKEMSRYSTAEIEAAVNAAAQAVFVKMDPESFGELFDNEEDRSLVINKASSWDGTLRSGRAINLLPGEDITSPELGRPNPNFEPFMSAFMGYVGIGLNIPKEVLAKHFQASYSAARAALLDAWRTFRVRRVRHASQFCQPIYEELLAEDILAGRIAAPGFFADAEIRAAWCGSTWTGDGPGSLDPLKEAKATTERLDNGTANLADEIVAYDGGDWETKHRQRVREVKARVRDGLQAPANAPAAPAPGKPERPALEDGEADDEDY